MKVYEFGGGGLEGAAADVPPVSCATSGAVTEIFKKFLSKIKISGMKSIDEFQVQIRHVENPCNVYQWQARVQTRQLQYGCIKSLLNTDPICVFIKQIIKQTFTHRRASSSPSASTSTTTTTTSHTPSYHLRLFLILTSAIVFYSISSALP